ILELWTAGRERPSAGSTFFLDFISSMIRGLRSHRTHILRTGAVFSRSLSSKGSEGIVECDTCVVGGGLVGVFTALSLSRQSKSNRVTLVEQFEPGHENGSSHGDGRIFRYAYPVKEYIDLAQKARVGWCDLEEKAGEKLLVGEGGLDIGPQHSPRIQAMLKMLSAQQVPHEVLAPGQLEAKFPQFSLRKGEISIYQKDAAVTRATPAIKAAWRTLPENVSVETGVRVESMTGVSEKLQPLELKLSDGRICRAGTIVVAAGAWAMTMLPKIGIHIPLIGTEECVAYFHPKKGAHIPGHTYRDMPIFIPHFDHKIVTELMQKDLSHDSAANWGYYGLPEVELPGVKIAAHHTGVSFTDPDKRPSIVNPHASQNRRDEILNSLEVLISHLFPHLERKPLFTQHCLYTSSADHGFVIDLHPKDSRIAIACGLSGHGFKFGPAIGDLIASLITTQRSTKDSDDTALFSISRFPDPSEEPRLNH
ncbi:hypothetical protein AAMO2058_000905700, partial [Amorphochlora amoebiformis]